MISSVSLLATLGLKKGINVTIQCLESILSLLPFSSPYHISLLSHRQTNCFSLSLLLSISPTKVKKVQPSLIGVDKMVSTKSLLVFSYHSKVPSPNLLSIVHHLQLQVFCIYHFHQLLLLIFILLSRRVKTLLMLILCLDLFKLTPVFYQFVLSRSFSIFIFKSFKKVVLVFAWRKATAEEMQALISRKMGFGYYFNGAYIIGFYWVSTIKYWLDGLVDRYKACLITKGISKAYNIDYFETLSLVICLNSICIIFSCRESRFVDILVGC